MIEAEQKADHTSNNQEQTKEVELGQVLTKGLVVLGRVEMQREEEECECNAACWTEGRSY